MQKKKKNTALITAAAAAALALGLMVAGTLLRMHTQDMHFWQAFSSFAADTFQAWKQ